MTKFKKKRIMVDSTEMVEQKQKLLQMLRRDENARQSMLVALSQDLIKNKPAPKRESVFGKQLGPNSK